jgi:hypothetical protein
MNNKLTAILITIFLSTSTVTVLAGSISKTQLKEIGRCSKRFENKSLSPIERMTVVGQSKGYFLLRVGDKTKNPEWEQIVRLNPCREVFGNPMGDFVSRYGVPDLPADVLDSLESQQVKFFIRRQGKQTYFNKIISQTTNGSLYLLPETYKALIAEGFKPPKSVRIILKKPGLMQTP